MDKKTHTLTLFEHDWNAQREHNQNLNMPLFTEVKEGYIFYVLSDYFGPMSEVACKVVYVSNMYIEANMINPEGGK